jgi:hypothetical protein
VATTRVSTLLKELDQLERLGAVVIVVVVVVVVVGS